MTVPHHMPKNPPGHFFLIHEEEDGQVEVELRKEQSLFGWRFSKRVARATMPTGGNLHDRDSKVVHAALMCLAAATHTKAIRPAPINPSGTTKETS